EEEEDEDDDEGDDEEEEEEDEEEEEEDEDDDEGDDDDDDDDDDDEDGESESESGSDEDEDEEDRVECEGIGPQLVVYPNPVVGGTLHIHLGLQDTELGGEVTLFSFMGIPLLNWTIPSGLEGIYQFSVDVSMVPPGTYTLSWSSATWLVEETIIIP
ncbi:MAG: T9SS type A sorting domain-containing protein, partial [Flavobacteriales bacterium]|nr:T9SS type A sorting domain-containing protein [Flavobacteriales bacterium]